MWVIGVVLSLALVRTLADAQIRPEVSPTELLIESAPNAEIFFDGKLVGSVGPGGRFAIPNPTTGEHTVRVELSGKRPFVRKVMIAPGKPILVRAELVDKTGDLEIFTTPGAEVLLNGKPAGVADDAGRLLIPKLKAMDYKVSARRANYNSEQREISVAPDVVSSVTVELKRIEAAVNEIGTPPAPQYVLHRRLVGHQGSVEGISFQPNSQLVSWGEDNRVIVWDPVTGRQSRTIQAERGIGIFDVSSDLHWIAVVLVGGSVHWTEVVDATNRRIVGEHHGSARAFTPDSKRIVVCGEHTNDEDAIFWDLDSGKQLQTWRGVFIGFLYSPAGHSIATGGQAVRILDAETGKEVRRLPSKNGDSIPLAFSPDGHWLAVTTLYDRRSIGLWEAATGRQGRIIMGPEPGPGESESDVELGGVAFTPDSQFLLSSAKNTVRLWDTATGRELREWPARAARRVALSADGRWMAVIGEDLTVWRRAD
jgi:WD40 repeat protein